MSDALAIGNVAGTSVRCGVVAMARHERWSDSIFAQLRANPAAELVPIRLPPTCVELRAALQQRYAELDLLLVFVTPDSAAWASRTLAAVRARAVPAMLVTRGLSAASIRQLLAAGADDFLPHAFDLEELLARLERPGLARRAGAQGAMAPSVSPMPPRFEPAPRTDPPPRAAGQALARLIGEDEAFLRLLDRIPAIAGCHSPVLVAGETGSRRARTRTSRRTCWSSRHTSRRCG